MERDRARHQDQTLAFALIGAGTIGVAIPLTIVSAVPGRELAVTCSLGVGRHTRVRKSPALPMQCYRLGEFSQVYPLARGISPPVVTGSWLWSSSTSSSPPQLAGVAVVSAGLAFLVFGGRRAGRGAFLAAVGTGLTIAAYTTVDGVGVRLSGTSFGYIGWLMLMQSLCIPMFALIQRLACC